MADGANILARSVYLSAVAAEDIKMREVTLQRNTPVSQLHSVFGHLTVWPPNRS